MIESDATAVAAIGFTVVSILQLYVISQTTRLSSKIKDFEGKIDCMVTDAQCEERQQARQKQMDNARREIQIVERKMDCHEHNGEGVKYKPYKTEG